MSSVYEGLGYCYMSEKIDYGINIDSFLGIVASKLSGLTGIPATVSLFDAVVMYLQKKEKGKNILGFDLRIDFYSKPIDNINNRIKFHLMYEG